MFHWRQWTISRFRNCERSKQDDSDNLIFLSCCFLLDKKSSITVLMIQAEKWEKFDEINWKNFSMEICFSWFFHGKNNSIWRAQMRKIVNEEEKYRNKIHSTVINDYFELIIAWDDESNLKSFWLFSNILFVLKAFFQEVLIEIYE